MTQANQELCHIAKQATKDVKPTTGWQVLPHTSNSISPTVELEDSQTKVNSRIKQAGMVVSGEVAGDIEAELAFGNYDDLIAAAFMNTWVADGGGTGIDQLTIGDTQQLFAIEAALPQASIYHLFLNNLVNTLNIDVPEKGKVKVKFGMMGTGYQDSKTTMFAASPTVPAIGSLASSVSVGDVLVDGSPMSGTACVASYSFDLNNNIKKHPCLGTGAFGGHMHAFMATITGKTTLAYTGVSHDVFKKQITGAQVGFVFPIICANGDKYIITIPSAQITAPRPTGGMDDFLMLELDFTAVEQPVTITRQSA